MVSESKRDVPEWAVPDLSGYQEMMTIPEVAEATRSSRSTVERYIATGRVAAHRPSRRKTLVTRASVQRLLSHPFNL
jgi:excisionase family DNA binding protein